MSLYLSIFLRVLLCLHHLLHHHVGDESAVQEEADETGGVPTYVLSQRQMVNALDGKDAPLMHETPLSCALLSPLLSFPLSSLLSPLLSSLLSSRLLSFPLLSCPVLSCPLISPVLSTLVSSPVLFCHVLSSPDLSSSPLLSSFSPLLSSSPLIRHSSPSHQEDLRREELKSQRACLNPKDPWKGYTRRLPSLKSWTIPTWSSLLR